MAALSPYPLTPIFALAVMVVVDMMLLVAPDFVRLSIIFVVLLLVALNLITQRLRPVQHRALPLWTAVSAGVMLFAPLIVLTAALGLVGWGLMSRDEFHTALNFLWARDIVGQLAWIPLDMGMLYLFHPTVVLSLLPSISLSRSHLLTLFVLALILLGFSRILNIVSLVVPNMLSPAQILSCVVSAVLAGPAALLASTPGMPFRANPWIALCVALLFELASTVSAITYPGQNTEAYYCMLVASACMTICAGSIILAIFHSPVAIRVLSRRRPAIVVETPYSRATSARGSPISPVTAETATDFMSLRDPFASPPPGNFASREKMSPVAYPRPVATRAFRRARPLYNPPARGSRQSNGSMAGSLDQAFLERLVTLSFASSASDETHRPLALDAEKAQVLAEPVSIVQLPSPRSPGSRSRNSASSIISTRSGSGSLTPTPIFPRAKPKPVTERAPTPSADISLLASPASSSKDWTHQLDLAIEQPESEDSDAPAAPSPRSVIARHQGKMKS